MTRNKTFCLGLTVALLTVSALEGQEAGKDAKNEHLAPFEFLIGSWNAEINAATGEPQSTQVATWKWAVGDNAIVGEVVSKGLDGEVKNQYMSIIFWDPSDKKVKIWDVGKGGFPPARSESVLVSNDDGFVFEAKGVFQNGAQFVAKLKFAPGEDNRSYIWGWSKISGAGLPNVGPYTFKRK